MNHRRRGEKKSCLISSYHFHSWQGNECVGALPTRILSIIHSRWMEKLICGKGMQTEKQLWCGLFVWRWRILFANSDEKLSRINQLVKCLWHACECVHCECVGWRVYKGEKKTPGQMFILFVGMTCATAGKLNWIKHQEDNQQATAYAKMECMHSKSRWKKSATEKIRAKDKRSNDKRLYAMPAVFLSHSIFLWQFFPFSSLLFLVASSHSRSHWSNFKLSTL